MRRDLKCRCAADVQSHNAAGILSGFAMPAVRCFANPKAKCSCSIPMLGQAHGGHAVLAALHQGAEKIRLASGQFCKLFVLA